MELWTAFVIGILGSLHCIGMCGPIAIALPSNDKKGLYYLVGRILYNTGRIIAYALLGALFGLIGESFQVGGYQQTLSIVIGVLMLLIVVLPLALRSRLSLTPLFTKIVVAIKRAWKVWFGKRSLTALFVVGFLNGFLPCGLVYVAVAGAVTTGSVVNGALYMAMFGIGTFPVMLAVSLVGKLFGQRFTTSLHRLLPIGGTILAMLFILRGLSLGIPYVSPKINESEQIEKKVDCCGVNEKTPELKFYPADSTISK